MKIKCRWHEEKSPSMQIYADGGYCFGCGKQASPEELKGIDFSSVPEYEPEDTTEMLAYIRSLPLRPIRGLMLPADDEAFYLLFPGHSFYKKRFLDGREPKYLGPRGHKHPLFVANATASKTLVMVEGEMNALSIAAVCPDKYVVSPGAASMFSSSNLKSLLPYIVRYSIITILVDRDPAGAKAAAQAIGVFTANGIRHRVGFMDPDANELLQSGDCGKQEIKHKVEEGYGEALEGSPI